MKHLLKLNCKAQETQVTKNYELYPTKLLPIRFCPISLDFQHLFEPTRVIPFHREVLLFCAALGRGRKGIFPFIPRYSHLLGELGDPTAMGAAGREWRHHPITCHHPALGWLLGLVTLIEWMSPFQELISQVAQKNSHPKDRDGFLPLFFFLKTEGEISLTHLSQFQLSEQCCHLKKHKFFSS